MLHTCPITLTLLLASFAAAAETLSGRVMGISDGDSLTVLVGQRQLKVRINGIDAPEKDQAFAEQSKVNGPRVNRVLLRLRSGTGKSTGSVRRTKKIHNFCG